MSGKLEAGPGMPRALAVCESCDTVHRRVALPHGARASCTRCGSELYRAEHGTLEGWLALASAAGFAFAIANLNPIVELELRTEHLRTTLAGALVATWDAGMPAVAVLAGTCALLLPMLGLALQIHVLGFLIARRRAPLMAEAIVLLQAIRPWSMVEVFVLGVVVSLVKLGGQVRVIPGAGLAGFAALAVLMTLLSRYDTRTLWRHTEELRR